ncbi:DNA gyrase subunit A, partial [Candidatus Berkelbacteria bacterium]|nr:DNA gyrase subunit A [Candidatus Berkelbacteria bacterium]
TKEEDQVAQLRVAHTLDDILFFTSKGRLFTSKVYELPAVSRQAKGTPIVNVVQLGPGEDVTAMITLNAKGRGGKKYFLMGTRKGIVKKTEIEAYKNVRKSGLIAIKLRDNDELQWVIPSTGKDQVIMVSANGQSIRFKEQDVRPMGRSASGVIGMKLREGDQVISIDILGEQTDLLVVMANGYGKRSKISLFGIQNRGGIGLRAAKVTKKTGDVVYARLISDQDSELVMISGKGQTIRMALKSVKRLGRDTQGVTLMRFSDKGDQVASLAVFSKDQLEENKKENEPKTNK